MTDWRRYLKEGEQFPQGVEVEERGGVVSVFCGFCGQTTQFIGILPDRWADGPVAEAMKHRGCKGVYGPRG